jgi:hypothetical protein
MNDVRGSNEDVSCVYNGSLTSDRECRASLLNDEHFDVWMLVRIRPFAGREVYEKKGDWRPIHSLEYTT